MPCAINMLNRLQLPFSTATLCRAAENGCYFATVNNAIPGASTTSAIIRPDGSLLTHQPYGQHGLLFGDINPSEATGYLANRLRPTTGST
jgi:predicted amidohydrolase